MKFWIIAVEDPAALQNIVLGGVDVCFPNPADGVAFVFNERDIPQVSKTLASKYPGREVYVLEQVEAYFTKVSAVTRKIIDKTTGEFVLS